MAKTNDNASSPVTGDSTNVSRRSVLQFLGVAFATASLPAALSSCGGEPGGTSGFEPSESDTDDLSVSWWIDVIRPQDLLVLRIGLQNLRKGVDGKLVAERAGEDSFIVLDFPPQAILEQAAVPKTDGSRIAPLRPVADSRLSGPSRLAFRLPSNKFSSADYTLESILTLCSQNELYLPGGPRPLAFRRDAAAPPPEPTETFGFHPLAAARIDRETSSFDPTASYRMAQRAFSAGLTTHAVAPMVLAATRPTHSYLSEVGTFIEMPFRLLLAPTGGSAWSHTTTRPETIGANNKPVPVELWHTKLCGRNPVTGLPDARSVAPSFAAVLRARDEEIYDAAVLNLDGPPGSSTTGAVVTNESLTPRQRGLIARRARLEGGTSRIQVNDLKLSALGGTLDARAEFPNFAEVRGWIHKMSGGREHFVQVTDVGFLLPFGHKAVKITITERNTNPNIGPIGLLLQYTLVLVKNPGVKFGIPQNAPAPEGPAVYSPVNQFPFVAVELKRSSFFFAGTLPAAFMLQRVTNGADLATLQGPEKDIRVPAVGYDHTGKAIRFDVPLYYYTGVGADSLLHKKKFNDAFKTEGRAIDLEGQQVAYAPSTLDDTRFETKRVILELIDGPSLTPTNQTPTNTETFGTRPTVAAADLCVESVRQLTSRGLLRYSYHPQYVTHGFPQREGQGNKSNLLFAVVDTVVAPAGTTFPAAKAQSITFKTTESGGTGFVKPDMSFNAVSRKTGPMYVNDDDLATLVARSSLAAAPFSPTAGDDVATKYLPFRPADVFKSDDPLAKMLLFGAIPLTSVLKEVLPKETANNLIKDPLRFAPKFVSEAFSDVERFIQTFEKIQETLSTLHSHAEDEINLVGARVETLKKELAAKGKALATEVETQRDALIAKLKEFKTQGVELFKALERIPADIKDLDKDGLKRLTGLSLDGSPPVESDIHKIFVELKKVADLLKALVPDSNLLANPKLLGMGSFAPRVGLSVDPASVPEIPKVDTDALTKALNGPVGMVKGVHDDFVNAVEKIDALGDTITGVVQKIQTIFTAVKKGIEGLRDMALKLEWRPKIQQVSIPEKSPLVSFRPYCEQGLLLSVETRTKAIGSKPAGMDIIARLDRFAIHFAGSTNEDAILTLTFKHLVLQKLAGKKPDIDLVFDDLRFGGPLSFVQTLMEVLPRDGFSDPPYLLFEGGKIRAGFTLSIPNLAVGMFSLENVKIGAELSIPLIGEDPLKFSFFFCDRDAPFLVTVSMLGGGGYFKFEMDVKGNILVEGSINIAASLSLNLFIASATVTISAGIFFSFGKDTAEIGGFLRIHGQLNVLGLITVSIDLRLDLSYDLIAKKVIGRAKLRVEIEIVFFSKTVEIEFERKFSGANGDPTMAQVMGLLPGESYDDWAWQDYACAFSVPTYATR